MLRSLIIASVLLLSTGCARPLVDASMATRAYPEARHEPNSVDIEVFRFDTEIEIVNATGHSYNDFSLWLNQRYVRRIDALPAGGTIRLSLWGFYDMLGEVFNAGGFWRTEAATPIWIAEIETDESESLIGLVTIGSARTRSER